MSPSASIFSPDIAIIGAGIAGVTLSIAISKQNPSLKLTIFEQRPEFSEVGAGVGFGPNAVKAMSLISPELGEAYKNIVTLNGCKEKLNTDFDVFCGDGLEKGEFLGEVVAREEKMRVCFRDGTHVLVDAVIGCDGIRSECRKIILGCDHEFANAVYTGKFAYRAVLPMDKAVEAVGRIAENRRLITGHGRHILFFPIMKNHGLNIAAFVKAPDDEPWTDKRWALPATKEDVLRDFDGFHEDSYRLLEIIEKVDKWGLFNHLPAPTFVDESGKFCIMGDAAHASSPHCGAGAGFAIEDSYILSSMLREDFIKSPSDIQHAFRAFDAIRRPRSQELVWRSRRQGSLFCLQLCEAADMISDFESNMSWVWDVDLDAMLRDAEAEFERLLNESL
ncbi:hypothetical protein J7T55_010426 [Diaporthe amygdali]|uniref:uncharacterized protein n=1 Tax=Phomopsis amygdali TaxID=1214568 RepID=UPI0022FDFF9C|nr:uncharacterized protein J7T55_010426 [Diaporthe amygdali]KAJ0115603.1 hypothetical protein J7T55_010426 [Diaporthe amygdali]